MERVRVRGNTIPGGHAGGVTPVPISNTEVKSSRADDTAAVRLWESRTLPGLIRSPLVFGSAGFFVACDLLNLTQLARKSSLCLFLISSPEGKSERPCPTRQP